MQTRMIWKVAHVYYQRPSLRDFAQLCANVASTAFIAAGIEYADVDVLVTAIFGSTVAAIAGMHLLAEAAFIRLGPGILAERAGLSKQAMNRILCNLERLGSIVRSDDPDEGRGRIVKFTKRGHAAHSKAIEALH